MAVVLQRNVIKKAVSISVVIQQDRKVKKNLQLNNYIMVFTVGSQYVTNKGWKAEKGGVRFIQAWHQKNLQTLYQRKTGRQTHVIRTL